MPVSLSSSSLATVMFLEVGEFSAACGVSTAVCVLFSPVLFCLSFRGPVLLQEV